MTHLKSTVWYMEAELPKLTKKKVSLATMLFFVKVNVMHGYIELVLG